MWTELLRLRISHAFFDSPAPIRVAVSAADADDDADASVSTTLHLRDSAGQVLVWSSDAAQDRARALRLDLFPTTTAMLAVTPACFQSSSAQLAATLPEGPSEWVLAPPSQGAAPRLPNMPLARLELTLPGAGVAEMHLRLPATKAHLAYHILGPHRDGLGIVDRDADVRFVSIGATTLPDGRQAQSFRSERAVALHRRVGRRFSLVQDGPFGPRTLIPALPGPVGVSGFADGNSAQLQSDMYVTL